MLSVGRFVADVPAAIVWLDEAATVAVGALVAGAPAPAAFDAVTVTVTVAPTSPAASTYVLVVAPLIAAQDGEHRFHAYAYDVGLFVHEPVDADNV